MIAVLVLAVVALATMHAVYTDRLLRAERDRVNDLLTLLEARAAPAEHAAYVAPFPEPPAAEYLTSEDGLVSVEVPDDA